MSKPRKRGRDIHGVFLLDKPQGMSSNDIMQKVDFASPWATPHSGDYDLDELFRWMDKVVAEGK